MNSIKTALSLLAISALVAPEISSAMNPTKNFAQIGQLLGAGKPADALKLCQSSIDYLNNPKSRVASQFNYLLPFFYWELARVNEALGDFKAADAAYKVIVEDKRFRNKDMIEAAKKNPGKALDYTPFFTMSMFKRGYNTYRAAAGTEKKPGDAALYPQAIEQLEKYYEMLRSGRVSDAEKKLKLDSQICLLLLQAALLQKEPNFEQATKYLELSRKSRTRVPDDMIINALNTIAKVAKDKPQYIAWLDKIISAAPENYNFGVLRGSRYANVFLKQGADAASTIGSLLAEGKSEEAIGGARSVWALFSLIPDTNLVLADVAEQVENLAQTTAKSLPDGAWGATYIPGHQKKVLSMFQGLERDNMKLESMSLLVTAQMANTFGSNRLAKASFKVVTDHYPNYSTRGADGKVTPFNEKNLLQLMAMHNALGEIAQAEVIEKSLGNAAGGGITKDDQNALLVGRAVRLLKEGNSEGVLEAASELERAYEGDKKHANYTIALFFRLAALYRLQRYEDLLKYGEPFLKAEFSGGKLDAQYETQALYFLMDAYNKLGQVDVKNYDRAIELMREYTKKHPSLDLAQNQGLIANVYYNGIDSFTKRSSSREGEARARDLQEAYENCMIIVKNWPDHMLAPIAQLLAGNILINGEDEKRKAEGITLLDGAAKSGIALGTPNSKNIAANALYWLASYSPEIPMPKEKEAAAKKRIAGYYDTYWSQADQEGDPYSLLMGYLTLKQAVASGDEAQLKAASERMQKLFARESNYSRKNNKPNTDLQNTFPSYVDLYFGTLKKMGKELSYEEKLAFHKNFPGIDADDRVMRAIIDINAIGVMNEQLDNIPAEDASAVAAHQENIEKAFREMLRDYKPEDLSGYGCVELGNYLIDYVRALPESRQKDRASAVAYFDSAINGSDLSSRGAAMLGKANALALSTDEKVRAQAKPLFEQVIALQDDEISPSALLGITRLHMAQQDYAAAVASGKEYVKSRANNEERLEMLMLLGEAYAKSGDDRNALLTYMNLYNQNRARVTYSAPACIAMMDLLWKRNTPSSGSHMDGNYKASDRWAAWNTGQAYVSWIQDGDIESKMTPADRDKYRAVARAVGQYASDAAVQKEDKEKRDFDRAIKADN